MSYTINTFERIQIADFLESLDRSPEFDRMIPSVKTRGRNLNQLCLQYFLSQLKHCVACGSCSEICFIKAIDIIDKKPVICKACQACKLKLLNELRFFPTELSHFPTIGKYSYRNTRKQ